jgi:retron-type reverse transcriptase
LLALSHAYRGVALEQTAFKALTKLIAGRICPLLEEHLPDQQFGFRRGRSTQLAAEYLIGDMNEELKKTREKKYVVFVDYSKAFDIVNRTILVEKLKKIIGDTWILKLISNILAENYIQVYDNTAKSDWISQTNGVLQGDPLSLHLFNVLTYDVKEKINKKSQNAAVYIYADDMALASNNREEIQKATDALIGWADKNQL